MDRLQLTMLRWYLKQAGATAIRMQYQFGERNQPKVLYFNHDNIDVLREIYNGLFIIVRAKE